MCILKLFSADPINGEPYLSYALRAIRYSNIKLTQ